MMAVLLTQDLFVGILEAIQGRGIEAFLAIAPRVIKKCMDRMTHLLQERFYQGRSSSLFPLIDRSKIPQKV